MSVWSKRIGGLLVASIVVAAVAGCGGHGSLPSSPSNNVVLIDGGAAANPGTSNTTITATDDPQTIEVTEEGSQTPIQAFLPGGLSVNQGQSLAIIPDNLLLLNGLTGGADRNPGDIRINGRLAGAHIVNGRIHPALALPAGTYTLEAEGPYAVRNGASQLTIGSFVFHFRCDGRRISLPAGLNGEIPANGSNNWTNSLTATFVDPYTTGTAELKITHQNGVLDRTVNLVNGTATYTDFQDDPQSHIPSQGVDVVEFTHL